LSSAQIYIPGQAAAPQGLREHPGRKSRTTAAGWVLDYLVPRNQTVLLCGKCAHGFNPKVVNYVSLAQRFGYVRANCDGCKTMFANCVMFVSESLLGTRSGKCWTPEYI
jgi:hypothetical protein